MALSVHRFDGPFVSLNRFFGETIGAQGLAVHLHQPAADAKIDDPKAHVASRQPGAGLWDQVDHAYMEAFSARARDCDTLRGIKRSFRALEMNLPGRPSRAK